MYENADELEWGRNLGCDFVKKSCFEWMATRQQRYLFKIDLRPRGCGFEPYRRHFVVVLEQDTFILA